MELEENLYVFSKFKDKTTLREKETPQPMPPTNHSVDGRCGWICSGSEAPHPLQFRADSSPPDPDPNEDIKEQRTW